MAIRRFAMVKRWIAISDAIPCCMKTPRNTEEIKLTFHQKSNGADAGIPSLLSTFQLAERTGVSEITWARRRVQGGENTPKYLKIGRSVKYRWEDVEVWLYEVVNGGHDWPGASGNFDINASVDIWNFFSMFMFSLGDVNGDSNIDILDVVQVINLILSGEFQSSADMNEDGFVNVQDIIVLVSIILGNDT